MSYRSFSRALGEFPFSNFATINNNSFNTHKNNTNNNNNTTTKTKTTLITKTTKIICS